MAEFKTIHTLTGLAKLASAEATGTPINLIEVAVGDGNGNPLYGNDPSIEQIAIINLALIGLAWWMADTLEEKNGPTWPLWTMGVLRAGVAIHNERVDC